MFFFPQLRSALPLVLFFVSNFVFSVIYSFFICSIHLKELAAKATVEARWAVDNVRGRRARVTRRRCTNDRPGGRMRLGTRERERTTSCSLVDVNIPLVFDGFINLNGIWCYQRALYILSLQTTICRVQSSRHDAHDAANTHTHTCFSLVFFFFFLLKSESILI